MWFPTLVRMRIKLPDIGEVSDADDSVTQIQVFNYTAKTVDKYYPADGKVLGTVTRVSDEQLSLHLFFADQSGQEIKFPFFGKRRIETVEQSGIPYMTPTTAPNKPASSSPNPLRVD